MVDCPGGRGNNNAVTHSQPFPRDEVQVVWDPQGAPLNDLSVQ